MRNDVDLTDAFGKGIDSAVYSVTSVFDEPVTLMLIAIAAVVMFLSKSEDFVQLLEVLISKFNAIFPFLKSSKIDKWILANSSKIAGALIFLPTIYSSPKQWRVKLIMIAVAYLMFAPSEWSDPMSVALVSLALRMWLRTRSPVGRVIVVTCAIGYLLFLLPGNPSSSQAQQRAGRSVENSEEFYPKWKPEQECVDACKTTPLCKRCCLKPWMPDCMLPDQNEHHGSPCVERCRATKVGPSVDLCLSCCANPLLPTCFLSHTKN